MLRFTIRKKLLFFSIALALIPLGIAGRTMIRITQDELKSSVNDQLVSTVAQLADEIDDRYDNTWLAPLLLIRNAIDNESLGGEEKISLMTTGLKNLPDMVSLQITVLDLPVDPLLTTREDFSDRLQQANLDPISTLAVSRDDIANRLSNAEAWGGDLTHISKTNDWLITLMLPLQNPLAGHSAALAARVSLERTQSFIENHPYNKTGSITLVDDAGRQIFNPDRPSLQDVKLIVDAVQLLDSGSRIAGGGGQPYTRPNGDVMLGGYGFPEKIDWAIIVEQRESDAYLAVAQMVNSLLLWVLIGFAVAAIGAAFFAVRISRPILEIDRVAEEVRKGNLGVRVQGVTSKDEIGALAQRMNEMIQGLIERFNLEKFVSGETIAAIKGSEVEGIKLGGERKLVTIFFSDIRGFTAFSEGVEPEVVIEMLNTYLRHQAYLVKQYHGDVDKYVGDELVAVFQGEDMVTNAVKCAVEIQQKMAKLTAEHPEWNLGVGIGINTGEVVMGAMGSEERMDYTILGDHVNLSARLCSAAERGQTLLSQHTRRHIEALDGVELVELPPIQVKGKVEPIPVFEVKAEGV